MRRLFLWFCIGAGLFLIKWLNPAYMTAFNYETAQHYIEMVKLNQGQMVLAGPLTSHPWLRLSSAPYYLFYPVLMLFNFHPLTLPWVWMGVSGLTIILNFWVVRRWFNPQVALISSGLMLLSPNFLYFDAHIGFYNFVIPLMYGLWWEIERIVHRGGSGWRLLLYTSFMLCLHASALMIVPVVGLIVWRYRLVNLKTGLAFVIPQLPLLIKAITDREISVVYLLGWIPYRVWQFIAGKTLGLNRVVVDDTTGMDLINFMKQSLLPADWSWWWGGGIILGFVGCFWFMRKTVVFRQSVWWITMLLTGLLALLIHKNPPFHYFVPLVSIPLVLISVCLSRAPSWLVGIVLVILVGINGPDWWSVMRLHNQLPQQQYQQTVATTREIIAAAGNQPFVLSRKGPFDYYPGQAKEQYEYLLWYLGHPTISGASKVVTIVEN